MNQLSLFDDQAKPPAAAIYPAVAGCKDYGGTSEQAAKEIQSVAGRLRLAVIATLQGLGAATADEIAQSLGESILSIRPRCSELRRLGLIRRTGERRTNHSGKSADVLELTNGGRSQ